MERRSLLVRTQALSDQGPTLLTPFNRNYLLISAISKYRRTGGWGFNIWIWGTRFSPQEGLSWTATPLMTPQRPLSGCELGNTVHFSAALQVEIWRMKKVSRNPLSRPDTAACLRRKFTRLCVSVSTQTRWRTGKERGKPKGALTLKRPRVSRPKGNKTQVLGKNNMANFSAGTYQKFPKMEFRGMSMHNNNSLITSENKSYTCFGQNRL